MCHLCQASWEVSPEQLFRVQGIIKEEEGGDVAARCLAALQDFITRRRLRG